MSSSPSDSSRASRRHFLHTAAAGAVLGPYALALSGQTVAKPAGNFPNLSLIHI